MLDQENCVSPNSERDKATAQMTGLPSQIYPDLSSVKPGLNPVEDHSPLCGSGSYKQVASRAAETKPHQKSAEEAETQNHHHIHILKL